MNFQAVRQIKGQKDGDFPKKVDMIGVFVEIGGVAYNDKGTSFCDCRIQDMAQEKHKVRLYVKEALPAALLNTECSFSISAYDGGYQGKPYVGYSGFWNATVVQRPAQGQVTPYQPPQAQQMPPQQANSSQGVDITAQFLKLANRLVDAIEHVSHGNATFQPPTQPSGPNPDYVGDNPPPPEDDEVPF